MVMSKNDRAEQRRTDKAREELAEIKLELENSTFTYQQVLALVNKRELLVQKMYSGLIVEVSKLGVEAKYAEGVWTLEPIVAEEPS
jgi:hypothetical protein